MIENKLAELEELVGKLEEDGVSIEDGIKLFENGLTLTKECLAYLNEHKGKITRLKVEMDKLFEEDYEGNGNI